MFRVKDLHPGDLCTPLGVDGELQGAVVRRRALERADAEVAVPCAREGHAGSTSGGGRTSIGGGEGEKRSVVPRVLRPLPCNTKPEKLIEREREGVAHHLPLGGPELHHPHILLHQLDDDAILDVHEDGVSLV